MSDWSSGIDAAAKTRLSTMLWNDGDGSGYHYWDWDEASDAMRDAARDSVLDDIRAFLSVQPSIRYCEEHKSNPFVGALVSDTRCLYSHWHKSAHGLLPKGTCRIVERRLVDAPHIG